MDMRRKACKLLSSWAMSLGLSMLVMGMEDSAACISRKDGVGDMGAMVPPGDGGPFSCGGLRPTGIVSWDKVGAGLPS